MTYLASGDAGRRLHEARRRHRSLRAQRQTQPASAASQPQALAHAHAAGIACCVGLQPQVQAAPGQFVHVQRFSVAFMIVLSSRGVG